VQTVPSPTPSRGTPVEPVTPSPVFTDDAPTESILDAPIVDEPVVDESIVDEPPTSPLAVQQPPATERTDQQDTQQQEDAVAGSRFARSRVIAAAKAVRRQLPYALVLLTMAIGLLRIVQYHWREGSAWIGGALLLAALLRAVLPPKTAGMVAVRGRAVDVLWCVGLAVCILFVAYTLKA
jgi:hypothetical protein